MKLTDSIDEPNRQWLHQTIPSLLDRACGPLNHPKALNQWVEGAWQSWSAQQLCRAAEELALGLQHLSVQPGQRIGLVMQSDITFAIADLGTLLAGVVNVPIDLTQTIENILFILQQVEAPVLVVSNLELLYQLMPYFWDVPALRAIIVADVPSDWPAVRQELLGNGGAVTPEQSPRPTAEDGTVSSPGVASSPASPWPPPQACLHLPQFLCDSSVQGPCPVVFPQCLQVYALDEVRGWGRQGWSRERGQELRHRVAAQDLATIIYTAGPTQRPRGVMLSHENMTANVLAAFSSYPNLATGPAEVALLYLPLTHIFARVFLYGHLAWGHSLYFSDPNHLVKHLRRVKPTILITVPRLLEKIHDRIVDRQSHLKRFEQRVLGWALQVAGRFDMNQPPQGLEKLQWQLADRLVFRQWRDLFGGRLRACICGGAALAGDLVTFFTAAGVPVFQGYGLTETSGVVCYNRGADNRAGTVGVPIPGVTIAVGDDQEILVRGPVVMQGYYRDAAATRACRDEAGWLHTGDLGTISADGFLTITGVKKPLFKLSTGKYVSPLPLEQALMQSPLVTQAVAVGLNRKFCGMVIFPNLTALSRQAEAWGIDVSHPDWLHHPRLLAQYQTLIDSANCYLPYWSTIRKFALVAADLSPVSPGRQGDHSINRMAVWQQFAEEIGRLYGNPDPRQPQGLAAAPFPTRLVETPKGATACPVHGRSLVGH